MAGKRTGRELRLAWDRDRFMEAVLGARLRFHVDPGVGPYDQNDPGAYWRKVYRRWAFLYHQGKASELADGAGEVYGQ